MPVVVIDTIKPKNNLTFPIVEDVDVLIKASGARLSEVVANMATAEQITALENALAGKASQADLTALSETVSGKASQSDLNALSSTVAGKQAALTETQLAAVNSGITSALVTQIGTNTTAIAGKASQADLTALEAEVDEKADAADLATATTNLQSQIDNIVGGSTEDSEVINARVGADGESYATLKGRLDAEENTQNKEISATGTFIDYGTLIEGKYIGSDGEEGTSVGSSCTDFVEIDTFYNKITLLGISIKGSRSICAYDASENLISCIATGSSADNEDKTFTIPENTKYIRFTAKGKTPVAFYADTIKTVEAECKKLNTDILNLYPQIINYGSLISGKFIDQYGYEQTAADSKCSDFIEVTPNSSIIFDNITIKGVRCAWGYNASRQPVKKLNSEQSSEITKIETGVLPSTVKYVRFSALTAQTPYVKYYQKIATDIGNIQSNIADLQKTLSITPNSISNENYFPIDPFSITHESGCTFNADGSVDIAAGGYWFPVFNIDWSIGDVIIMITGVDHSIAISHSNTGTSSAEQEQPYLYTEEYDNMQICYIKKAEWFEGYPYAHIRIDNRSGKSAIHVDSVIAGDNHIANKGTKIAYVSTSGSDSNIGSESEPFQTITKALNVGAEVVLIAGGVYSEPLTIPTSVTAFELRCSEKDKKVVIKPTDYIIGTSESKQNGYNKVYYTGYARTIPSGNNWIYQENIPDADTLISDSERHPLERGYEYRCEDTKIVRCTADNLSDALDEIENANGYRFYLDDENDILYYSRPNTVSSSNPITISNGGTLFTGLSRRNSVKLVGIETKYLKFNLDNASSAIVDNCKSTCVCGAGAFTYNSVASVTFIRCEAARCQSDVNGDGFNGHSVKTGDAFAKQTTALFIDCYSHDNLDDGYSDHERSETTLIGGLFEYNGKGGVVPSYGSQCTCYNVYSRNNYAGFYYTGTADVSEGGKYGQMYCYNCIAENNRSGGSRTGYRVDGDGNTGVLVGCKSINNNIGYYADTQSELTLIDCTSVDDTQIKGSDLTIKNTTLVI